MSCGSDFGNFGILELVQIRKKASETLCKLQVKYGNERSRSYPSNAHKHTCFHKLVEQGRGEGPGCC